MKHHSATAENRRRLVELCTLSASRGGSVISADELPEELVAAIAAQMAKADPQKLNYATPGNGTTPQLLMELFKLTHVDSLIPISATVEEAEKL